MMMAARRSRTHSVRDVLSFTRRAEQTMGMPAANARYWTYEEVLALIDEQPDHSVRYEYADGELLVTPGPHPVHQRAVGELIVALSAYLQIERVGHVIPSPSDVELEPEFIAQPDVFVVPMAEWRRVAKDEPPIRQLLLAAEVLSPSSSRHDRVRKRPLYQRNVPDYWIIDLDARLFEHWTPADDRPALVTDTLVWQPAGAATPCTLDLRAYFASVLDA